MGNNKPISPAAERLIEHADIICNYAESIIDELTILKAIMADDEDTIAMLESL